ncbi:MAG: hypothetical protein ACJ71Q_05510 [Terriglobales bacterium]
MLRILVTRGMNVVLDRIRTVLALCVLVYGIVEASRLPHRSGGLVLAGIAIYYLWRRWQTRNDSAQLAKMQEFPSGSAWAWWLSFLVSGLLLWWLVQAR